jgi:hypothetical protein
MLNNIVEKRRSILFLFHFHISVDENPSSLIMDLLTINFSTDSALMVLEFFRTRVGATEFNFLRKEMKKVTCTMVSLESH